jgi:nicotinamidase-related amidase
MGRRGISPACAVTLAVALFAGLPQATQAQSIIEEWDSIKAPPPPLDKIKPVQIDPKKTALLSLDWNRNSCTPQRRVRCHNVMPKIEKLLAEARSRNMVVVHGLAGSMKAADILDSVAPKGDEPVVTGKGDKFTGSDLEKILKDKGIDTVIIVGTSANSAVMYTAFGAAVRGFKPIVPIDGMPADTAYQEQFAIYQIAYGSQLNDKAQLTRLDLIKF